MGDRHPVHGPWEVQEETLVWATATPSTAPGSPPGAATHLSTGSTTIASTPSTSIAPIASIRVAISSTISAIAVGVIISPATSLSSIALTPPSTSTHLFLGSHLLDLHCVGVVDRCLTLLDQLLGSVLPGKGDEGEGLGLVVFHLVDRPDHLNHTAKLLKVSLQVLLGEGLARGELADVPLALASLCFLASHLLALDNMGSLCKCSLNACQLLEHNEGKAPRPASHGIHLQVDVLNVTKGAEVLLDVSVFCLLGKSSNKEFPVIFMDNIASFSHASAFSLLFLLFNHGRLLEKSCSQGSECADNW